MRRCIIACRTLERELNFILKKHRCQDPVIWLNAGDHNVPSRRKAAVEAALAECEGYDKVLLVMSFCGNALLGIDSGTHTLLLPCLDDCIGLLLKEPRRSDTYYLTDGWLAGERNILVEYESTLEKYGPERTTRIFTAMLRNYRYLAYLNTGIGAEKEKDAARVAEFLKLEYLVQNGYLDRLEDLVLEQGSEFVQIPPHTVISPTHRVKSYPVTVLPAGKKLTAKQDETLLQLLRTNGFAIQAPCGGQGTCGKCRVSIDGQVTKACSVKIDRPMTVILPEPQRMTIAQPPKTETSVVSGSEGFAAFDIGTTTVVCSLLDGASGQRLAVSACPNPQSPYGADVVTRIRAALNGNMANLTSAIRICMTSLLDECCRDAGTDPKGISRVCVVGNPAMQQLFLGIPPENLVQIPFHPVLTQAQSLPCSDYLPNCPNGALLVVPDISAYVGADTVAGIFATSMADSEAYDLLVDIGTNGEMVLGNRDRMMVCATAAGPALEGANIRFGTSACEGAIDHLWLENGEIQFSTIGGASPTGICGSGLIDALAVFLEQGKINSRGRIQPGKELEGQRILPITDRIYLTQEDVRQVQLAKGAICAGIHLLLEQMGLSFQDIRNCYLAGGFGTYLHAENACRIGLLPPELRDKIRPVGNSAIAGAEMMVKDPELYRNSEKIAQSADVLDLASLPAFPKAYASAMRL